MIQQERDSMWADPLPGLITPIEAFKFRNESGKEDIYG